MSELELRLDPPASGAENMRVDRELLERCAEGDIPGVVRIYSFAPACLSLGRLQSDEDVDRAACARDGVDVVRRPTGGRAVLHDREVTYAVVCPTNDPHFGGTVLESCARIHRLVARALESLGVVTQACVAAEDRRAAARATAAMADCFATPSAHELVDAHGRKLVGSAQARLAGALLQHGSILLEPHRASAYLGHRRSAGQSSSLATVLGRDVRSQEVAGALAEAFGAALGRAHDDVL
jgi:lipoate-protein ligase A